MGMNTSAFSPNAASKIAKILGEKIEIKKEKIETPKKRKELRLTHKSEYNTWTKINSKSCERWKHSFENFVDDMGRRPGKSMLLFRKNKNQPYSKENCKWGPWEKTDLVRIDAYITPKTHAKLKRISKESGMSMSRCMSEMVNRSKIRL